MGGDVRLLGRHLVLDLGWGCEEVLLFSLCS